MNMKSFKLLLGIAQARGHGLSAWDEENMAYQYAYHKLFSVRVVNDN